MLLIFNTLFVLLFQFSHINSKNELSYISNQDYYSIGIIMNPGGRWGCFIDTFNEYLILYDPPNEYEWPKRIIARIDSNPKDEYISISNYGIKIKAQTFSTETTINSKKKKNKMLPNFKFYYTKEKCQDDGVWSNIHSNTRQLSVGLGLGVKDEKYSLVHSLFKEGIISKKCFSFDHNNKGSIQINFGAISNENIDKYKYSTNIVIPSSKNKWGFTINSITIERKKYNINKYAYINSGLNSFIRSKHIYNLFNEYFTQNSFFKDICIETNNKIIKCLLNETIDKNVTFSLGSGIEFTISLNYLFKTQKIRGMLDIIYPDKEQNEPEESIHLGKSFLQLFNLIMFDFDSRKISFKSNLIEFSTPSISNSNHILYVLYFLIILVGISSGSLIFLINTKEMKNFQ